MTTVLFDSTTEIGESTALAQTGEVTQTLKVDDVKIVAVSITANLGTAALFKFTGVCDTIEFTNFLM
jgi:hypothetical protein